ncbi:hypothetical protein GCM10023197_38100 [Gordonia humi]
MIDVGGAPLRSPHANSSSNDSGDRADFNKSSRHTETRDSRARYQRRFVRREIGSNGSVRGCEVDPVDEEHRPLHDIIESRTHRLQCRPGIRKSTTSLRSRIFAAD